jgi:hypothetical protein
MVREDLMGARRAVMAGGLTADGLMAGKPDGNENTMMAGGLIADGLMAGKLDGSGKAVMAGRLIADRLMAGIVLYLLEMETAGFDGIAHLWGVRSKE